MASPGKQGSSADTGADAGDDASGGTIKSVVVAAYILEALANAGGPVRLADLSRQLDMPRARIHRHLKTLRELGFVSQERNGERYWLGSRLFHLGQAAMEQFEITRVAERPMHNLRDRFGQTIVLSTRLSATASAQGRVSLAFAPAATRERVLGTLTASDRSALEARLTLIRDRLYEFSSGETLGGINVLAAPLLGDSDDLAGVVAVVGAAQDIAETPEAVATLQTQAAEISAVLGSTAYDFKLKGT